MLERVRLHISPLNPELLPTVLPPSVLSTASNISYHSLYSFPERNYGFVEVSIMDAEKIKKKLNGSILKGSKMKVEVARPDKRKMGTTKDGTRGETRDLDTKSDERTKKRKRENGVLPGFELPDGRKVKRGWTDPVAVGKKETKKGSKSDKNNMKGKTKAQPSTFSENAALLFRTTIPQSARKIQLPALSITAKSKKRMKGETNENVIVHEFSNSTKPGSFLRKDQSSSIRGRVSEYVNGQGWLDENGSILEPELESTRGKATVKEVRRFTNKDISPSGSRIDRSSKVGKLEGRKVFFQGISQGQDPNDETSSSGTSSSGTSSSSEDEDIDSETSSKLGGQSGAKSLIELPQNDGIAQDDVKEEDEADSDIGLVSGDSSSVSSHIEVNQKVIPKIIESASHGTDEVHPLEALFKPSNHVSTDSSRKPTLEVRTSFSFFDADAIDKGSSTHLTVPQTPFTQQDIQERRMRSAAPTPDTAAPSKMGFGNLWGGASDVSSGEEENVEDDEENDKTEIPSKEAAKAKDGRKAEDAPPESDFAKWFWEHRGETNRAWKKRRREAAKEKRQKENKKRSRSAI
ncbi:hypothetical protein MMC06_002894 [Schaereria dolodes]|nr:hypothetical protein [Schaereria dolodes]